MYVEKGIEGLSEGIYIFEKRVNHLIHNRAMDCVKFWRVVSIKTLKSLFPSKAIVYNETFEQEWVIPSMPIFHPVRHF